MMDAHCLAMIQILLHQTPAVDAHGIETQATATELAPAYLHRVLAEDASYKITGLRCYRHCGRVVVLHIDDALHHLPRQGIGHCGVLHGSKSVMVLIFRDRRRSAETSHAQTAKACQVASESMMAWQG